MNFPRQFLKPLNFLIPKKKYHIYSVPHINGLADCYDLLNYGSDNLLCVLHELLEGQYKKKLTIYIECYSRERIPIIKEYLARTSNQSINIIPIESYLLKEERKPSVVRRIKNTFIRYQCSLWLSDTGFCYFQDKLWCQKHVCLNYSTPLKAIRGINWKNDFSNIDGYIETSLLTSYIHSAGFKVKLDNCLILGFPRNDILFYSKNLSKVKKWIEMRAKEKYKKIIVYAPTYREYKSAYVSKCVFGYDDPENKLEKFLSKEKILIVVKMHPLQEYGEFIYSDHVIPYEANYNFSFYDLLALSDLLVSDYSSVIHDYILTGKNVVLNFSIVIGLTKVEGLSLSLSNMCVQGQ